MHFINIFILGIIEGITEFLPVSSTAHLLLAMRAMGLGESDFWLSFSIVIQLGAILAVVVLYFKSLILNFGIIKKIFAAFVPTAIIGLVLYKVIKSVFMNSENLILFSLFFGGFFIIVFEMFYKEGDNSVKKIEKMSYKQAFIIGVFQSIAMIPGVSRSAATIIGGLFLGLNRKTIVEFSFLLAIPTMAAAAGLDILKNYNSFSSSQIGFLALGFVVSFIVAIASIKFLLYFIKKFNFISFGVYRMIASALFYFFK